MHYFLKDEPCQYGDHSCGYYYPSPRKIIEARRILNGQHLAPLDIFRAKQRIARGGRSRKKYSKWVVDRLSWLSVDIPERTFAEFITDLLHHRAKFNHIQVIAGMLSFGVRKRSSWSIFREMTYTASGYRNKRRDYQLFQQRHFVNSSMLLMRSTRRTKLFLNETLPMNFLHPKESWSLLCIDHIRNHWRLVITKYNTISKVYCWLVTISWLNIVQAITTR